MRTFVVTVPDGEVTAEALRDVILRRLPLAATPPTVTQIPEYGHCSRPAQQVRAAAERAARAPLEGPR
jgi:hypothetical protein